MSKLITNRAVVAQFNNPQRKQFDLTNQLKWTLYRKVSAMPINANGQQFALSQDNIDKVHTMSRMVNGTVIYIKFRPEVQMVQFSTPKGNGEMDYMQMSMRKALVELRK